MQKRARQNALLSIIGSQHVSSQADLAKVLNERGFAVTQASVSRDLDELEVVKVNGRYSRSMPALGEIEFGKVRFESVGENLIIVRCASGLASAVTVKIDSARLPEIAGTIAGDDTIFIAVRGRDTQEIACEKIAAMFS